jgi:hypothetical protein
MGNTHFGGFSTGLHSQNRPVAVGRIPDSCGLATEFVELEFAGILCPQCFHLIVHTTSHINLAALCTTIAMEWDWLAAEYI